MKILILVLGLLVLPTYNRQEVETKSVTVPCEPSKCRILDLWNETKNLELDHYDTLVKLQDGLIHDPPGMVRSLDREQTLEQLLKQNARIAELYREMLALERK